VASVKCWAHPYSEPVTFTDDPAQFARLTGTPICDTAAGLTGWHKKYGLVVGVFDGDARTLVHELVHCVLYILDMKGIKPYDIESKGEPMAYLTDYLYGYGLRLLGKRDLKGKSSE